MSLVRDKDWPDPIITGIGITSAVGQGKDAFISALLEGRHSFDIMRRPGRQKGTSFIGAEIPVLSFPEEITGRAIRKMSFSEQAAMITLDEAWKEANLDAVDPERIGLIVGGSNFHQRNSIQMYEDYRERTLYVNPTYGFSFLDSDLCGLCSGHFGIKGLVYTVGGASASGQLAILMAIQALQTNQVDVCIAMGGLMDLSFWECQALRSLGAMGTDRYSSEPAKACRPFDKNRDGFIYGESCGAIVIELNNGPAKRPIEPYAAISGWALVMDGNRHPDPSYEGELRVIEKAISHARLSARDIDYINPHGTGSVIGDEIELKAIADNRLVHAFINTTKSITGHGLSAAGTVEIIATLLQMKSSRLHPSRNLDDPIDPGFNWVKNESVTHTIRNAISLSIGFGGINTALCVQNLM